MIRRKRKNKPARSNFKSDNYKTIFGLLLVVTDCKINMIVQGITNRLVISLFNQHTTNGITMFIVGSLLGDTDIHNGRQIVNEDLSKIFVIDERNKLFQLFIRIILLSSNRTYL